VNDEGSGAFLPERPVDVHLHGIAPQKSPGAPMRPNGIDEWKRLAGARFGAEAGAGAAEFNQPMIAY